MRTGEGKWVLFELATGKQGEFWPIDARALLALGTHAEDPPTGAVVTPPVMPPARVGAPRAVAAPVFEGRGPEALPDGYSVEHAGAGYYTVTAPDGANVPGPSKGKFQGKDGAASGAWAHLSA